MAPDADSDGRPTSAADAGRRRTAHAGTDRPSAGRSTGTTPESLYLWQIAVLQTRVDALRTSVEHREQDLQHVIDRYEHVLHERSARDDELLTDGGKTSPTRNAEPTANPNAPNDDAKAPTANPNAPTANTNAPTANAMRPRASLARRLADRIRDVFG